jgi:hypothetical protein
MSRDGGRGWTSEKVNFGMPGVPKTLSLALDHEGRPLVAGSLVVISPPRLSLDQGHGGYWMLRLVRREAAGDWRTLPTPVDERPEWAAPLRSDEDMLCDWVRVLADPAGGIHLAFQGTAVSRIYGHDQAYYAWRSPDGRWRPLVPLREPDPGSGIGWSYAPGLTLDGDRALALVFYGMHAGRQERGFDADLEQFRDGRPLARPLPVTRFASDSIVSGEPDRALSAWFPGAAPSLARDADGRIWADILVSLAPSGVVAPSLIVWTRLELTAWLKSVGQ